MAEQYPATVDLGLRAGLCGHLYIQALGLKSILFTLLKITFFQFTLRL